MAIIPRIEGQENVRLQPNSPVPIGDSSYAGVQGRALETFGETITRFGEKQLELSRELTRKETQIDMENTLKEAAKEAELKSVVGPDGRSNYQEIATKYANDRLNKIAQEKAGWDPRLQDEFTSYAGGLQKSFAAETALEQVKIQKRTNEERLKRYIDGRADSIREMPSDARFKAEWEDFGATIQAMTSSEDGKDPLITADQAEKLRADFGRNMIVQYAGGMKRLGLTKKLDNFIKEAIQTIQGSQLNPNQYQMEVSPQEAFDAGYITSEQERDSLISSGENYKVPILEAGPGSTTPIDSSVAEALRYVPTEEKEALILDLMKSLKQGKDDSFASMSNAVETINSLVLNYDKTPEQALGELQNVMKDLANVDAPAYRKQELVADAVTTMGVIDALRDAPLMHERDFPLLFDRAKKTSKVLAEKYFTSLDPEALKELGGSNTILKRVREKEEEVAKKRLNEMVKLREEDPAEFLANASPKLRELADVKTRAGVQKYFAAMKALQEKVGVKNIRLYGNDVARQMAMQLDGAKVDAEQMVKQVSGIRRDAGRFAPLVEKQLSGYSKALSAAFSLNTLPNETKVPFMNAVLNKKEITEAFSKVDADAKTRTLQRIGRYFDEGLTKAHNLANRNSFWLKQTNDLKDAVTLVVQDTVAKDPSLWNDQKELEKVVKESYSRVVEQTFLDPRVMQWKNSAVMIKRHLPGSSLVLGEAEGNTIIKNLRYYSTPEGLKTIVAPKNDPRLAKDPERFYSELADSSAWTTTDDGSSLLLVQREPTNMRTWKPFLINGKRVTLSIEKMVTTENKAVEEYNKGFKAWIRESLAPSASTLKNSEKFTPVSPGGMK